MAMTLISEQTLGSSAASVTFSSIPSTYKDLEVEFVGTNTAGAGVFARFNSDSGSNYSWTRMLGDGSSASSARGTSETGAYLHYVRTGAATFKMSILSYSNGSVYKSCLNRSNDSAYFTAAWVNLWRSTAAISTINFYTDANSFAAGSTFRLWGVS